MEETFAIHSHKSSNALPQTTKTNTLEEEHVECNRMDRAVVDLMDDYKCAQPWFLNSSETARELSPKEAAALQKALDKNSSASFA